ncbi:hypothetical protein K1719_001803 [Acacia pycnantha]|nr:hypothetical protein K1719_001803 [Acacia pycnantha]
MRVAVEEYFKLWRIDILTLSDLAQVCFVQVYSVQALVLACEVYLYSYLFLLLFLYILLGRSCSGRSCSCMFCSFDYAFESSFSTFFWVVVYLVQALILACEVYLYSYPFLLLFLYILLDLAQVCFVQVYFVQALVLACEVYLYSYLFLLLFLYILLGRSCSGRSCSCMFCSFDYAFESSFSTFFWILLRWHSQGSNVVWCQYQGIVGEVMQYGANPFFITCSNQALSGK